MPSNVTIVELSPLKVSLVRWKPQGGSPMVTVVCKATYDLAPGEAQLAEVQDDVNERDLHAMNNPGLGLHSASDLVPFKPRADVTLVGKAYAPPGELSRHLVARLKVGSVDKRVGIHADRYFSTRAGQVRDQKFFSKMALGYEKAPGGKGTANPAGLSLDDEPNDHGRIALPNMQHPDERIDGRDTKLTPVGFGPIPWQWPTRKQCVHAQADGPWLKGDFASAALPSRWDWSFFNVAPPDQQLDEISADAKILLEHLHPEEAKLECRLPGLRPVVFVEREGAANRLELKGDTLWIDTNRLVQTLTWRGQVTLSDPDEAVRVVVTMAKPGADLTWEAAWHLAEAKANHAEDDEDQKKTIARAPRSVRAGQMPASVQTGPVPLTPASDHTPQWVPGSPSSDPQTPPPGAAAPPPSARAPLSSGVPVPSSTEPSGPGAAPSSPRGPASGGLTLEVALSDGETRMLRDLCQAMGYDAVDMLKYVLREAHDARFG